MKRFGVFGVLFLLFWAIPFPMFMYYTTSVFSSGSSPLMAFVWLGIALLFSTILLAGLFKRIVLGRFIAIRKLNNLMQNGDLKNATIVQSTLMPAEFPGVSKYKLLLELQSFVGTTIREIMYLNDSKPELHTFETGKTIKVRIDKSLTNVPYIQLDGAHYNGPKIKGILIGGTLWVIAAAIIGGYYVYAYQHQNNGTGWRFLEWNHPLIISQGILIILGYVFRGGQLSKNQLQHKYYGYETQAQVISTEQTGVYINNQPQVRFNLQFTDKNKQVNNVSIKKTIGILNTALVQQKTMDIFYLAEDPQNICLATELEPTA
jgi:hypothetical protein